MQLALPLFADSLAALLLPPHHPAVHEDPVNSSNEKHRRSDSRIIATPATLFGASGFIGCRPSRSQSKPGGIAHGSFGRRGTAFEIKSYQHSF